MADGSTGVTVVTGALGVLLGVLIILVGAGIGGTAGMTVGDAPVVDRGTARTESCVDKGFVDGLNIGDLWDCTARVRWDSGDVDQVTTTLSQLRPEDIGRDVAVVKRTVTDGNRTAATTDEVFRADFAPNWLVIIAALGVGWVVGIVVILLSVNRIRRGLRGRTD